ncbi:hypothetical protein H4R33_000250 [Dimargaris cristalligena]|nr:hypothetical protein H4R33_000250 [Dimargaris cristalligena]
MSASPITSVQPQGGMGSPLHNGYGPNGQPVEPMVLPSRLYLDVRGTEFIVERDSLGSFPESILAAMFPNGMSVVARTTATVDEAAAKPRTSNVSDAPSDLSTGSQSTDTDPHLVDSTAPTYVANPPMDLVRVDFHPAMLRYILDFYQRLATLRSQLSQSFSADSQLEDPEYLGASYDEYPSTVDMSDASMVTAQTSLSNSRDGLPANNSTVNHSQVSSQATEPSETPPSFASSTYMLFGNIAHPYFLDKQAVIVLREDLDYFTIVKPYTPKSQITPNGPPPPTSTLIAPLTVGELKTRCGDVLLEQRQVFSALERNMHQHQGPNDGDDQSSSPPAEEGGNSTLPASQPIPNITGGVEQQLIDMLCVSGFSRNANWGCRVREPNRSTVSSLALVRLEPTGQPAQSAAAQKLLLFWKKPARKCWWDGIDIYVNNTMDDIPVRIWCRRMWTLELVLV